MYFWLLLKNIPQRLKTGFVVEGHILRFCIWCDDTTTSVVPLATLHRHIVHMLNTDLILGI